MDNRPIGIFDSGVGGLTVFSETAKLLPDENIVYLGDTARVPYGTRSAATIVRYAEEDIAFLKTHDVKLAVAACGTVSSVYEHDDSLLYTGVVSVAAKAAAKATKSGRILVIGTAATVASGSYEKALKAIDGGFSVSARACPLLVPLVENGYTDFGNKITTEVVKEYLSEFVGKADTLILGCTHFPILSDIIGDIMGGGVTLINPGAETAVYVRELLEGKDMLGSGGERSFYVTDDRAGFEKNAALFLGERFCGSAELVRL
jgi:glutamate racemase